MSENEAVMTRDWKTEEAMRRALWRQKIEMEIIKSIPVLLLLGFIFWGFLSCSS